jgi:hypothetical protein
MKSPLREQFDLVESRLKQNDKNQAELRVAKYHLQEEKKALVLQLIKEEKLLNGTTWFLKPYKNEQASGLYLEYTGSVQDEQVAPLQKLTWDGWHSSFEVSPDIDLRFDDSILSISFQNTNDISPFIKEYGLLIKGNQILKKLEALDLEASGLRNIVQQFDLIE